MLSHLVESSVDSLSQRGLVMTVTSSGEKSGPAGEVQGPFLFLCFTKEQFSLFFPAYQTEAKSKDWARSSVENICLPVM